MTRRRAEPSSSLPLFARNFRLAQARAGLNNREVAQSLGVSESQVNKWRRGDVVPRFERVVEIAQLFELTTDWFADDHTEEPVTA